jgi:hypothetical protein
MKKPKPSETITLLTPEAIQRGLEGLQVTEVSAATKLHPQTIYAWRRGEVSDPTFKVWKTLSDYVRTLPPVA